MAVKLNTALRNILAAAFAAGFDSGTLIIYTGSQPTNAGDAPTGTVLATISLPADAFGDPVAGVVSKAGTWQDNAADNSGVTGWFRLTGPGGTPNILDGSVGATGSGAQLEIDNTTIVQGGVVTVTAFTVTQPAG